VDITVSGSGTRSAGPEQARLYLDLGFDSGDRREALTRTTQLVEQMSGQLREVEARENPPIVSWSMLPVLVHPYRPPSDTGEVLPWRFRAGSHVEVCFTEVDALTGFMEEWGLVDGVTLGAVDWTLTDRTRALLEDEALGDAVAHAQRRATVIARSAGASAAHVVAVEESGLGEHPPLPLSRMASYEAFGARVTGTPLELRPDDIKVTLSVRARFRAELPGEVS
jgi:uncharacterized protein YggE